MSAKPHQSPYFDASTANDAASFVSTLSPPSYHTADDNESVAPLIDSSPTGPPHYSQSPQLLTPSAATATIDQDGEEDKIIMTSITVKSGAGPRPRRNVFYKFVPSSKLKIVLMPQSEYNKYFAKDKAGTYIGTEPQREWTEAELDEHYGKYKSALPNAPMRGGSAWKEGGGWGSVGGVGNVM